ncbi:hypothetical protein AB4Y36_10365 [Paraburkholderia sp. BR10936]|uniref:glycoside hydrolase family protein n=1 Tax=Paraburkholderia sp. BR10936 TaxID=3236993 RepID=UPI0034D36F32
MAETRTRLAQKVTAGLAALIGANAAALCIHLTGGAEGKRNDPYLDRVGNTVIPTVCYGQTGVPMRHYSTPECDRMLSDHLGDFAVGLKKRLPEFDAYTDGEKAALIDYAYNRGLGNLDKASGPNDPPNVLVLYRTHDPARCDAFERWAVVKRGGKWVDCSKRANQCFGIYVRRMEESVMCRGESV